MIENTLISTVIASIVTAFIFGAVARKMQLPAIFGYLIAGVFIGPHTPGFVADVSLAKQLAEIGIILLMFGVGLHFSIKELFESRKIALPGAIAQMSTATIIGTWLALALGYDFVPSLVFAFSLSVASTIVLLRALEQRNIIESKGGKIAISWLIIEDIAMVLALVMLPMIAEIYKGSESYSWHLLFNTFITVVLKVAGFFVFMIFVGRRFLPWLLVVTAKLRSAELNMLCTLAIALGFASLAYVVFDASFALGAFLAGVMLNETEIGRKSSKVTLPIRDAFSVLFFVSVGMLFDPKTIVLQPVEVLLTFLIIVVVKSAVALVIMSWFNQAKRDSYIVAIGLSQIGEFSFILGGLALTKGLFSQDLYNLILAGSMLSIVVNPLLFMLYDAKIGGKVAKIANKRAKTSKL